MGIIYDIRENTDTILFICEKIGTRENPYFDILHPVHTVAAMFLLI